MNRHERRKQKKVNSGVSNLQNELFTAIQLHTKRDFENAETLYRQIILKEPNNYDYFYEDEVRHKFFPSSIA